MIGRQMGGTDQYKLINTSDHMSHIWINLCQLAPNEGVVQYLVIPDDDTEVHYSLSYRNSDVSSVWTEVLNGRVRSIRDLNRKSHSDVFTLTCVLIPFYGIICNQEITDSNLGLYSPNCVFSQWDKLIKSLLNTIKQSVLLLV